MSVQAARVVVTPTATPFNSAGEGNSELSLFNVGSSTVYIGGPEVTDAEGFPLGANQRQIIRVGALDVVYGITTSSAVTVAVLRS